MPDSPRRLALPALVAVVGLLGAAVLVRVSPALIAQSPWQLAQIAALAVAVIASGFWSVKIPGHHARISFSEVFVFVAMLLTGWQMTAVIVAMDGALVSLRQRRKRLDRVVFNVSEPVVAIALSGLAHGWIHGQVTAEYPGWPSAAATAAAFGMAAVFFICNSLLTAAVIAVESGSSIGSVWAGHARHLAANYYAAAAIAILVVPSGQGIELQAVGIIVPLLILSFLGYREAAQRVEDAERHAREVERLYSEARQRDEALRQAQKLEALGRLAGGVSHDFNNMMTAIRGYAEMAREALPPGTELHDDIGEILTATDRAAGLARQLLAFSRRHVTEPKVVWPDRVIAAMSGMLARLIGEDITLITSGIGPVAKVRIDPVQLEQIVMNLVVNARDAMPSGGAITVTLADAGLTAAAADDLALAPGAYLRLSVSDTGCGMTEEIKSRVFEPFFTTKAEGHGTGLGLATVFGIVHQAHGAIGIDSTVGVGTSFHIHLPTTDEAETVADVASAQPRHASTGTILVVEDDSAVSALVTRALRHAGFEVFRAVDAQQALELARCHAGPIDLLLTDVVMPGMNGRELADRIAQFRPDVRLLFMSGYSDDTVLQRGVEASTVEFIQKPFTLPGLVIRVQSVLAGGRPVPPALEHAGS